MNKADLIGYRNKLLKMLYSQSKLESWEHLLLGDKENKIGKDLTKASHELIEFWKESNKQIMKAVDLLNQTIASFDV